MGHGRALVNIEKREDQLHLYEQIIEGNLSVRQTENTVRNFHDKGAASKKSPKKTVTQSSVEKQSEKELSDFLATQVTVRTTDNEKGKIAISFNSREELQRVIKLITGE
jgi:ParB family chromosome partitioning protein